MFKKYFREIYTSRYIISSMVRLDVRNQYRNSILGMVWNFLAPLMMCVIIGGVYSILFSYPIEEFIPFLFSGLTPWLFMSGSSDAGCKSFLGAEGYVKQTNVPVSIYPMRLVLVNYVNCIFSVIAYFVVCFILGVDVFSLQTLLIIPSLIILLIFSISLGTINGYVHTFFRDYAPINSIIMQALFYVTPIIYPASRILDTDFNWLVLLNPFYYIVTLIRTSMLGQPIESSIFWFVPIAIAFILFILSCYLNKRIGRQIVHKI